MPVFNNSQAKSSTPEFISYLKKVAGKTVISEETPGLQDCPVFFKDQQGQEFNFKGVNYLEAVVQSPLVEEGSGQLLCHPESTRTLVVLKKEQVSIPATFLKEEGVKKNLVVNGLPFSEGNWVDTLVSYGTPVLGMKYKTKKGLKVRPLIKWAEIMPGILKKATVEFDVETNMASIEVEIHMVVQGDNEKYRGFGKARGNGGFLRNIEITTNEGQVVFNPKTPLKNEGKYIQVEHVVGPEEYKVLNYLIGMVAHEVDKCVWNSLTGMWEIFIGGKKHGEEKLEELIAKKAKKVNVKRDWLSPKVYQMFKDLYGEGGKWEDSNFEFNDSTFTVIHHKAPCWVGLQTQIIECPLTLTFTGRSGLFAEHIAYLGTEYPNLFGLLMESVRENSSHVDGLIAMALGEVPGATEENPFGNNLIFTDFSVIEEGEKWGYVLDPEYQEQGISVLQKLIVPPETELDQDFLKRVSNILKKNGHPALIFQIEGEGEGTLVLELDGFLQVTGDVNHKAFNTLSQLISLFFHPEEERDVNWLPEAYRLVMMLQGAISFLVADSDSLLASASKTKADMLTCRRLGTLDASVMEDEIHAHPAFLEYLGIKPHFCIEEGEKGQIKVPCEGGFYAVNGRVPMPGASTQKWVSNTRVPFGVVCQLASVVKAQDQGDHDGDSTLTIVLTPEGLIHPVKGAKVNPISD